MSNIDREHPTLDNAETESITDRPAEAEKKLGMSMLMKVALCVLVISSLIIGISCLMQANQAKREIKELQAEIDDREEKIKKLIYYINADVDDAYIEEIAREIWNMYYPDEDIYYKDVND